MCGIAGFFDLARRDTRSDAEAILRAQIGIQRYRGPDAVGIHVGAGYGFGHARLSIIDVSGAANQPMSDASGSVFVTFNGEIYNFQEIRDELERLGHRFRTRSDTEVIVEGYAAWGLGVVDRLRGMFALAIHDARRDRLVLLRDRVGKKPLNYAIHEGVLVFASEIKGVLCYPGMPREANYAAIHEYLTYQYVPSPMTAFAGIAKLPPAHLLICDRGKEPVLRRYYSLPRPTGLRPRPMAELQEELVAHLKEATRLRMISDVPIGAFLSGGVDSSAVVAMMAMSSGAPVKTFTIGFAEQTYDERDYARAVAQRYGTDHHEMILRPDGMAVIDDIVFHYGEPFADSSAIATYTVAKIAREQVTVALNGDGGDESFLGYPRYLRCRELDTGPDSALPRPLARRLQKALAGWPMLQGKAASLYTPRSATYEKVMAYFVDAEKEDLYAGPFRRLLAESALDRMDSYLDAAPTFVLGAAWADLHTYLPDDLLVKVDIASMAHSLEARSPLLDHKLMEWAARIPESQRFCGTELKSLFKKAMEPYLPADLLYRPKMGFGVPVDHWLRGEMRDFARDTLLGATARQRGLFDPRHVEGLLDAHDAGEDRAYRIWALLMLELWFRMWIDTAPAGLSAASSPAMQPRVRESLAA